MCRSDFRDSATSKCTGPECCPRVEGKLVVSKGSSAGVKHCQTHERLLAPFFLLQEAAGLSSSPGNKALRIQRKGQAGVSRRLCSYCEKVSFDSLRLLCHGALLPPCVACQF